MIPVDFSRNTEVAIKKAIEFADENAAQFYLLHIESSSRPFFSFVDRSGKSPHEMMREWKQAVEEAFPHIKVRFLVLPGIAVLNGIIKKALDWQPDLIVIGKSGGRSWVSFLQKVSPGELARKAHAAVLTVRPGSLHHRTRTVVVPVIEEVSQPKKEAIAALCKKSRLKVHLVTFSDEKTKLPGASALIRLYQWLKESLHCPVEYAVLPAANKTKALLLYAEMMEADVLLADLRLETKNGGLSRRLTDMLSPVSKMQVLAV
jgi:nucleotide-binding universal stress UspA family protein